MVENAPGIVNTIKEILKFECSFAFGIVHELLNMYVKHVAMLGRIALLISYMKEKKSQCKSC